MATRLPDECVSCGNPEGRGIFCPSCRPLSHRERLSRAQARRVTPRRKYRGRIRVRIANGEPRVFVNVRGAQVFIYTKEELAAWTAERGGKCDICHRVPEPGRKRLSVDHDHVTHTFRGLLCNSCNLALGQFKDNVAILQSAVAYLQQ